MTTSLYQQALTIPWAIEQSWVEIILNAAKGEGDIVLSEKMQDVYALQLVDGTPLEHAPNTVVRDGVAIISVFGPIIPRATMFSRISAITSTDLIGKAVQQAIASPEVKDIILYMDTPGGAAKMINELSNYIYSLRTGSKGVYTYVVGSCNSAGYWFGSSSKEIIIDATADVGSIGVVLAGENQDPKPGTKPWKIVSSRAPKKHIDPSSEEGHKEYLHIINSLETVFFESVAKNMDVTIETVANDFGQGSVLVGEQAVKAGMAHRIGSLEGLISELSKKTQSNHQRGLFMSDENKTDGVITKAYIEKEHPAIAQAFKDEAKAEIDIDKIKADATSAERNRISQINALHVEGFEQTIKACIEDGSSPESTSHKLLTEMKSRGVSLGDLKSETTNIAGSQTNSRDQDGDQDPGQGNWEKAAAKAGL